MSANTAKQQEQQSAVPVVGSAVPEDAFMETLSSEWLISTRSFDCVLSMRWTNT